MVMEKWYIALAAVFFVIAAIVTFQIASLSVFDTAQDKSIDSVKIRVQTYTNGAITEDYNIARTRYVYDECQPDIPGYAYMLPAAQSGGKYEAGTFRVVTDFTGYSGRVYQMTSPAYGLYLKTDLSRFTAQKPRQHPDCIAAIREFVKSAGVNVTEIVFIDNTVFVNNTVTVNNTVVERIYTNQTIYVCSDNGKMTIDAQDCASPVPIAGPMSLLTKIKMFFVHAWQSISGALYG